MKTARGVHGQIVKVVGFKPLAPHCCRFKSQQGLRTLSCEEAIQLAYRTSVDLLRCPFVPGKKNADREGSREICFTVTVIIISH
jgi:hypothetical protein